MDAQVKGYLEAWGARLLHLAATDPQAYVETRRAIDEWWAAWSETHWAQISPLEQNLQLREIERLKAIVDDIIRDHAPSEPLDESVPHSARRIAPYAQTYGELTQAWRDWLGDMGMDVLTQGLG